MPVKRILITWLLFVCAGLAGADDRHPDDVVERFFAELPGSWVGQAVETPVGPVDYPIMFHGCENGVIAGMADLSVSDHYWRFWRSDDELRLTFLSTFRGNRQPVELLVAEVAENTIHFRAPELALLTLSVSLVGPNLEIRVYHHQEPHVHIRLTRSGKQMTETARAENRTQGCINVRQPESW